MKEGRDGPGNPAPPGQRGGMGVKRKTLSRKVRQQVYEKYDGHCAYCGCELAYKDMQVDHVDPCYRNDPESKTGNEVKKSADELNQLDNLMPSCRMCNFYKGTGNPEMFRDKLQECLLPNTIRPFQFRLAQKYGLVEVHEKPIRFYFEEVEERRKDESPDHSA